MARLSAYTQEVDEAICARIAEGEPLRRICRDMDIAWRTVYDWREAVPEFAARLARARDMGQEAIVEEALEIADTPVIGEIVTTKATGDEVRREDMLGHRKLQIETRLKLLAVWNPAKYGEKRETTHRGGQTIVIDGPLAKT